MTVFPREDDLESPGRIVGREVTKLPRGLRKRAHKEHLFIERASRAHIKKFILFLVEQLIFIASDNMAPEFVGPLRYRIFGCIKESLVVGGPIDRPDSFDALAERLSCAQIFYVERILAIAGCVGRIRQQVAVIAHAKTAQSEKRMTFRKLVQVEENLFRRLHAAFFPAL